MSGYRSCIGRLVGGAQMRARTCVSSEGPSGVAMVWAIGMTYVVLQDNVSGFEVAEWGF